MKNKNKKIDNKTNLSEYSYFSSNVVQTDEG